MDKKIVIYFFLTLMLMINFMMILWPLQTSHWWDETVYLQHAEVIFSGKTNYDEFEFRPPMLSILLASGFLFKHHVFTASVIVALLGVLGTFFMYLIGKEISDEKVGLLSALFFGFTPFIIRSAHSIMTDIPSLVFFAIAFYFLLRASKRDNSKLYFLSGFFLAVAILTRFTQLILISVFIVYIWVNKIPLKKVKWIVAGSALLMIPYLVWAQVKVGFFLTPFIKANRVVSDQVGNMWFYVMNITKVYPLVMLSGLLFYVGMMYKKRSKIDGVLMAWILIFVVYISLTPHKEWRYILPITVPLFLICARGYVSFLERKSLIVKGVVLGVLLLIGFSALPNLEKLKQGFGINQNFINTYVSPAEEVSAYLKGLNESKGIYANHEWPVYGYYTDQEIYQIYSGKEFYEWFPNNMKNPGFFILYKEVDKHPTQAWLDSKKEFKRRSEIKGIVIYEYTPATII